MPSMCSICTSTDEDGRPRTLWAIDAFLERARFRLGHYINNSRARFGFRIFGICERYIFQSELNDVPKHMTESCF